MFCDELKKTNYSDFNVGPNDELNSYNVSKILANEDVPMVLSKRTMRGERGAGQERKRGAASGRPVFIPDHPSQTKAASNPARDTESKLRKSDFHLPRMTLHEIQ